ncbi:hypothetical protein KFV05_08910 [Macrococcoides canis]|uniref:hypothetical protein n=1 Tax=Macrococcoides canis TaxID=1855823 RepID=UPI0020B88300|nr:hypothetical protein [Macrococcus canis]UTH01830.1 hypothetical protein KFV05_08910 [Macrococcus canis]
MHENQNFTNLISLLLNIKNDSKAILYLSPYDINVLFDMKLICFHFELARLSVMNIDLFEVKLTKKGEMFLKALLEK